MRKTAGRDGWVIAVAILGLVAIDQTTKLWVQQTIPFTASVPVVADVLSLSYFANRGAVAGIGADQPLIRPFLIVMGALTILAVLGGYAYYRRQFGGTWRAQAFVVLSVAPLLSTLLDRIRQGFVVDFIHLLGWPIFNFADLLPDFAAAFLLVEMVALSRRFRRRSARRAAEAPRSELTVT